MSQPPKVLANGLTRGLYVSHGTLEIRDFSAAKAFFCEVLGIEAYRHSPQSMFIRKDAYMTIACVQTGQASVDQGVENRWRIDVASREAVDEAYAGVTAHRERYAIDEIKAPADHDERYSFMMRDASGNWWEIEHDRQDYSALFPAAPRAGAA
jgi:catechol-2,3-dioxygenase